MKAPEVPVDEVEVAPVVAADPLRPRWEALVSQDVLLRELEAELCTGMPGPPPPPVESARLKRARLLRLDRNLRETSFRETA